MWKCVSHYSLLKNYLIFVTAYFVMNELDTRAMCNHFNRTN